jgi:protein TonB
VTVPEKAEPKKVVATAPKETPAPPKAEPVAEPKKVDSNALYKKSSSAGSNGTVGKASGTGGNNNGDDASGVGDKGNPDGNINAKQFYGTPGGTGSGVSLNIAGWRLASNRIAQDNSGESGKIVFKIKVDDKGDVISVGIQETRVSPTVTEFYKQQVYKLQLVPKGSTAPPVSSGTYTIIIRSN